jgi:hypothetical protein
MTSQADYIDSNAQAANFGGIQEEEAGGGRFTVNDSLNPSTSAEFREKEKRHYLKLANEVSFGKLENHLREFVRSIPFRPAPTYVPPGQKASPPARPSKFRDDWDQVFERDPVQQDILNHSASFRYCTQRLAMGFHSPYEEDRRVIDYKDFAKVLSVPNPTNYEQLDPHVVDLPESALEAQLQQQQNSTQGSGGANINSSRYLAARINAAKKKGVPLKMSKSDVTKELARMDAEDAQDKEIDAQELLQKRQAERDAQKEAERKRKEEEEKSRGRPQVVNMYDLPDWRHATGRCQVTTMNSWKGTKSGYF